MFGGVADWTQPASVAKANPIQQAAATVTAATPAVAATPVAATPATPVTPSAVSPATASTVLAPVASPSTTGSSSDQTALQQLQSSGLPPSWYTAGATTYQQVLDSQNLLAGGTNSAGQTQDDLNYAQQMTEWNETGGAAMHPYGVGSAGATAWENLMGRPQS